MINSTTRADKCGVCNGDNSGANTITKSFSRYSFGMYFSLHNYTMYNFNMHGLPMCKCIYIYIYIYAYMSVGLVVILVFTNCDCNCFFRMVSGLAFNNCCDYYCYGYCIALYSWTSKRCILGFPVLCI